MHMANARCGGNDRCVHYYAPYLHELHSGGVWGGTASPSLSISRTSRRHSRRLVRERKILGGSTTLQTSHLVGDRVTRVIHWVSAQLTKRSIADGCLQIGYNLNTKKNKE